MGGGPDSIKRITIAGFSGFVTETEVEARLGVNPGLESSVGDITPVDPISGRRNGTEIPSSSDRVSADVVGFDFLQSTGADIAAGEMSKWIAIRTNAKEHIGLAFHGFSAKGSGVGFADVFIPVPEPATILFGITVCGVIASSRSRRNRQEITAVR